MSEWKAGGQEYIGLVARGAVGDKWILGVRVG